MDKKMYNYYPTQDTETSEDQKKIWILEGKINRAEKSARKHQKDAAHWQRRCYKAERKLADIGQQAYNKGYLGGLGIGLAVGCIATIADGLFWRKLLK